MSLLSDLKRAAELLPPGSLVTLSREALLAAIDEPPVPTADEASVESERLLTAEEVAERLGTSSRWVYDHADRLGVRRLSRRCVRFSSRAVTRYSTRPSSTARAG
jgi:predicted DNA-binding transcriptional regulator AlpA